MRYARLFEESIKCDAFESQAHLNISFLRQELSQKLP